MKKTVHKIKKDNPSEKKKTKEVLKDEELLENEDSKQKISLDELDEKIIEEEEKEETKPLEKNAEKAEEKEEKGIEEDEKSVASGEVVVENVLDEEKDVESESDDEGEGADISFYEKVTGKRQPEDTDHGLIEEKNSSGKLFLLGAFVFVLTVLVSSAAGLYVINSASKNIGNKPVVEQKEIPTPTPVPVFDKSLWSFEVLNGGSVAGLASKTADKIKELGFEVSNVSNSDEDVSETTMEISSDATEFERNKILEELKTDFGDLTFSDKGLDSSKKVRLIVVD